MSVPTHSMIDFMPVDMAEMMQEVMKNPQLLSRRFELAQLVSRIMILYQRLQTNEAAGGLSLDDIRDGLSDIKRGEIVTGTAKIEKALTARMVERETYEDIFTAMSLLKDMTRTEMQSIKEMKQIVTLEQMLSLLSGIADTLTEALEKYVADERTRQLIAGDVARSITRRTNASIGSVLPEIDDSAIEGEYTSTEQVVGGALPDPGAA